MSRSPCPKRERCGARVAVVCAMPKSRSGAKCAVLICLGLLGMDQAGLDASAAIAAIAAMALIFFSCLIELHCFGTQSQLLVCYMPLATQSAWLKS